MSTEKPSIISATLIATILFIVLGFLITRQCQVEKPDQAHISVDTTLINMYKATIQVQDSIIFNYEQKIATLTNERYKLSQKIKETRKIYEIKIKNIKRYTPSELDSFFTNRYKQQ